MTPFTLDRMRADVARVLREDPQAIGLDDNLMDWGLDSMRLLDLIMGWNADILAMLFCWLSCRGILTMLMSSVKMMMSQP